MPELPETSSVWCILRQDTHPSWVKKFKRKSNIGAIKWQPWYKHTDTQTHSFRPPPPPSIRGTFFDCLDGVILLFVFYGFIINHHSSLEKLNHFNLFLRRILSTAARCRPSTKMLLVFLYFFRWLFLASSCTYIAAPFLLIYISYNFRLFVPIFVASLTTHNKCGFIFLRHLNRGGRHNAVGSPMKILLQCLSSFFTNWPEVSHKFGWDKKKEKELAAVAITVTHLPCLGPEFILVLLPFWNFSLNWLHFAWSLN